MAASRSFGWRIKDSLPGIARQPQPAEPRSSDPRLTAGLLQDYEASGLGWFWATDREGRLTYISANVAERLGKPAPELLGQTLPSLFELDREADEGSQRTLPFLLGTRTSFVELTVCPAGGGECWWALSGRPQQDAAGEFTGYHGHGRDITETRRHHQDASRLAMYDSLTGLANRHRMGTRLATTLTAYQAAKRSCALLMIDLDRFKQVNDTLGHQAGDELLKQVAQRLLRAVDGIPAEVGRLGGDEFQVMLPDIDDRGQLGELAQKIITMVSQPYSIGGDRCVIGASVGIAIAPYDGLGSEELVRSADLALYAAKGDGRGRYRFYSSELHSSAEERRQLEDDLRDALEKGEIWLAYQPVVGLESNAISGFEALLRWRHPERGAISPSVFIPIAEEAGLVGTLGEWALRQACQEAATWDATARVAVNVSPIQFAHSGLPALVASALASSGLPPERLELEITESVFLGEGTDTQAMFEALKKLGVRLALDDFGTGFSSLGYLRKAPFDKIKIDQSFVRGATEPGNRNAAIIAAIVSLAEALDMETTAEGIEALDTLELMRRLKVSHAQGYVYSKPLDSATVRERLGSGELVIVPSGPGSHRSDRKTLLRKVGVIHEDHRYDVTLRNLSSTGAMIEGLLEVPLGTIFVLDFGEGQLAVATVRRSEGHRQGLEFEQPLISDGADGLCTRHRVSPYVLAAAGMPLGALPPGQYPLVGQQNGGFSLPAFSQIDPAGMSRRVA